MFTCLAPGAIGVKANLEEGLALALKGGFQGLDVNMREVSDLVDARGPEHVMGLFAEKTLRIGAWGLGFAWNWAADVVRSGLDALPRLPAAGGAVCWVMG